MFYHLLFKVLNNSSWAIALNFSDAITRVAIVGNSIEVSSGSCEWNSRIKAGGTWRTSTCKWNV